MKFTIPLIWKVRVEIDIEADTLDRAKQAALDLDRPLLGECGDLLSSSCLDSAIINEDLCAERYSY